MKIAYVSWTDRYENLSSLDIRKLQGVICPRHSMDYEEDLVWTNIVTCKACNIPHFGSRWRWIKSKSGSVYVPMKEMKAKEAPAYIRDVIKKLKRKIKGRAPVTPHVMYHQSWFSYDSTVAPDNILEFGIYCVFERFPKGYGPDKNVASYFPETV